MDKQRSPEEINNLLNEIGSIWSKYPQLRLGQLISNALYIRSPQAKSKIAAVDLFYLEDNSLIEKITKFDENVSEKRL